MHVCPTLYQFCIVSTTAWLLDPAGLTLACLGLWKFPSEPQHNVSTNRRRSGYNTSDAGQGKPPKGRVFNQLNEE